MAKINVYHGSGCEVKNPSLAYGREDADFGVGFYVTFDLEMAERWAARRKTPVISVYEVDFDCLNGLEFELNKGWLDFVVENRSGNKRTSIDLSEVDYIVGATADDRLFAVIEQYESNLIDSEVAVEALDSMQIGNQIALRTEEALKNLEYTHSYILTEARKEQLKEQLLQARMESNRIVEGILKKRVEQENRKEGPAPVFRKRKDR